MKYNTSIIPIGIIFIIILSTVSLSAVNVGIEFPICTAEANQHAPSISGDIVVWYDGRNGNYDIYGYDLSTSTEFPICTNNSDQFSPSIYGDIVVWHDYRNGNYDIYGYDLSTSTEFPICTASGDQNRSSVYGDIVVWQDGLSGDIDIYGYNLSTSTEFPICTVAGNQYGPSISGNIVVWQDGRNGNYDIYGYDLSTSTEFPICTVASDQSHPSIYDNIVVWQDSRNGSNWDIYGYDLSTSTEFPICTVAVEQRAPSVSGNIVVWYDERNVNADIYGYDLSTSTEFPICTDSSDQYTPSVSGSIVAWHDGRNSSYDIYGVRLEEPLSVEITSATPNHCAGTIDVTAEATGGTGPYSYAWDIDGDGYNDGRGASTTLDAGYDYSGTIRVQVTDDNSNQATDGDDSASTLSQLEIEITTFDINHCAGIIHAMASASGGDGSYTFDWDLDNDGVYDVLDAGTEVTLNPGYGSVDTAVVRVTDGNACTATESQAYSINDQLTVSLSAEYLNTGSATFTANCMGGDGSYTFDWDLDNDGSFDIIGSAYLVQTLVQPSSNPGLVTVHVYDGNGCACTDSVGYEIDTLWSPVSAQPLVTTALENANNMWQCIYPYFAECDDVDVLALMDEVQAHMRCAMSIANPIEASGELNRAMSLMNELAIRLACPCGV